ncbi:MAG TPA: phosphotransferase family protein [Candidatus Eisenbacteria bacterium]|nr:phosphotransferase family protein [Candidatus Eisenbacteria bacterium]
MTAATLVDRERLERWAAGRLPGDGPITVEWHQEGHSNLTYVVARDGREWILRRPPAGPLLPTAHDVVREYRVMDLLARSVSPVRVPPVVAVCEDPDVVGAPFYLMDRVEGTVIRDEVPGWLDEDARHALGLDVAATLAEIHRAPIGPFLDAGLGKEGGYLTRQLRRWVGQREGIQQAVAAAGGRARDLPDYDAVRDWLMAHLPEEQPSAVVHGDYKLDNVIVGPDEQPRVAAVVDWEMATIGDPRADLGYLLSFWPEAGERYPLAELVTTGPGFPTRGELVATWERGTGREAGDTTWFVTLAVWKLAVLLEASYHRHLAGTADDPFFATLEQGVPDLLAHARQVCGA